MVVVIKQNGRFDIERRNTLHHNLTKHEAAQFLLIAGVSEREWSMVADTMNAHYFGDVNHYYMFSKVEADDFLVRRRDGRVAQ